MIKKFVCLVALSLCVVQGFSQSRGPVYEERPIDPRPVRFKRSAINPDKREKARIGIRAGFNISEFNGLEMLRDRFGTTHSLPKHNFFPGYSAGFLLTLPLSNTLYFQPELDYTLLSSKVPDAAKVQTLKLGSVNAPLLLKFKPGGPYEFFAGPVASYLLFARFSSFYRNVTTVDNVTRQFNLYGLSLTAGMSYSFTKKLGIELRLVHGMSVMNRLNYGHDLKNNGIQANMRYSF